MPDQHDAWTTDMPVELQHDGYGDNVDMSDLPTITVDTGEAGQPVTDTGDWHENLAESQLSEDALSTLGRELREDIERDRDSRKTWDDIMQRGISALGMDRTDDKRSDPFPGASAVTHPMLLQGCVDYNARTMREAFPPGGPVKAVTRGKPDEQADLKAARAEDYMNWLLTDPDGIPGYRTKFDQLFMRQPLEGSIFRKVSWDFRRNVPKVESIGAGDFFMPYPGTSFEEAPRRTHQIKLFEHEVRQNIESGLWRDVPLRADEDEHGHAQSGRIDRIMGMQPSGDADDERYVVWECHCYRDLDEEAEPSVDEEGNESDPQQVGEVPYIVTLCANTGVVLAVRRNWKQTDPNRNPRSWFAHYPFAPTPWEGTYAASLYHMIGGLSAASTGSLRALMDSAALNNMQGGFQAAGMAGGGEEITVEPLKFKKVQLPAGVDDVRKLVMPFPFKEPSATLFSLLQFLDQSGAKFASVVVDAMANADQQAPVGTTLALIEQQSMVYSSIRERQHRAQAEELRMIREILHEHMDNVVTVQDQGQELVALASDFDGSVSLVPRGDPEIFSNIQRVARSQAALQLVQQAEAAGVQTDKRRIFVQFARDSGLRDVELMFPPAPPPPPPPQPMDPVSELRAVLQGQPVKVYPGQAHDAHVGFLGAMLMDPQVGMVLQQTPAKLNALQSLIADHVAQGMSERIAQMVGQPLPQPGQPLPPQVEFQVSQAVAQAAQQIAAQRQQAMAAQAAGGAPVGPDPVQAADVSRKAHADQITAQLEAARIAQQAELKREELQSRERITAAQIAARQQSDAMKLAERAHAAQQKAEADAVGQLVNNTSGGLPQG